ncbi:MAG: DNA-directed RNA polymerase subunit beta [Betaproteobacteria bacterium]|nr:DNA-directed RNA polymerase subunit beta [Betaproteobacteria bacterium]
MKFSYTEKKRPRLSFARRRDKVAAPSLLKTQLESYRRFLHGVQMVGDDGVRRPAAPAPEDPDSIAAGGLLETFKRCFPITSNNTLVTLEFVECWLEDSEFSERECKERGMSYEAKIKVKLLLKIRSREDRSLKSPKEEAVYMGSLPLMTDSGSFIINGTERVIVSQLHRAPSVYFMRDSSRTTSVAGLNFQSRVIPYYGCWLDLEFDTKNQLHFRIDKRQKMPVTLLLMAIGYNHERIISEFYDPEEFTFDPESGKASYQLQEVQLRDVSLPFDICDANGEVIAERDKRIKRGSLKRIAAAGINSQQVDDEFLIGRRTWETVIDEETGEVLLPVNKIIDENDLGLLRSSGISKLRTIYINDSHCGDHIARTLSGQDADNQSVADGLDRARVQIYKKLRPGDPIAEDAVSRVFNDTFFNHQRYSLSRVGRMKMNQRLGYSRPVRPSERAEHVHRPRPAMEYCVLMFRRPDLRLMPKIDKLVEAMPGYAQEDLQRIHREVRDGMELVVGWHYESAEAAQEMVGRLDESGFGARIIEQQMLSPTDIINTVKELVNLANGVGSEDDIDSLGNRRVRSVGEFVQSNYEAGLKRFERAIRDRLQQAEVDNLNPSDFVNAKTIGLAVRDFFMSNQLSQFMDQNNPLSEVTHKRRVSALGIGGLQRDRAGFEVRDVHPSHYGRLCPIETPEGPNIGLINSFAVYAQTDEYGFIVTPYRRVREGKVTDEIVQLDVAKEYDSVIAQANTPIGAKGAFVENLVSCRKGGEFISRRPEDIDYIDIAPAQIASIAAALIPFLEHDDANRALMGSNMQRQAVPCISPEKPLVGTGEENILAAESGQVVRASHAGTVDYVDAARIVIVRSERDRDGSGGVDIYNLTKYMRSNQNTNISQRPLVAVGDAVAAGDTIADASATDLGELALGQNLLVAFMPWHGYNFEDSILISEKVVIEDRFTSVHIVEHSCKARDTRNGPENINRDVPNQSERALAHLDASGIVQIGTEVAPGDILVGKVSPKAESQDSPEDRLLTAIFGEKGEDVKDTSLRLPDGGAGTVIDVKVFTETPSERDERALSIIEDLKVAFRKDLDDKLRIYETDAIAEVASLAEGQTLAAAWGGIAKGSKLAKAQLKKMSNSGDLHWQKIKLADDAAQQRIEAIKKRIASLKKSHDNSMKRYVDKIERGDIMPSGINKTVKVYVAIRRGLQVGDKMAGRHGNKGVVSRIVPVEDMPYMADGTPVDIVLNPLGVPSRMNIGQVLETHLGLAAKGLGDKIEAQLAKERQAAITGLRSELDKLYNRADAVDRIDFSGYSDDEIIATARRLKSGVPMATPIFDGAREDDIVGMLKRADLPASGQMTLYEGRTGEPFELPVTVGIMYMLKLHHLVEEKMHARSTGPYSLVTQQPLGGKAQQGGQRLGEMEVWALEAYGAAHILWEMLTVKSDDVTGRTSMYDSIVNGDFSLDPTLPESFKVLKSEIRSLGIDFNEE